MSGIPPQTTDWTPPTSPETKLLRTLTRDEMLRLIYTLPSVPPRTATLRGPAYINERDEVLQHNMTPEYVEIICTGGWL